MKASNAPGTLKPILFNTEMVRGAILAGKTCTGELPRARNRPLRWATSCMCGKHGVLTPLNALPGRLAERRLPENARRRPMAPVNSHGKRHCENFSASKSVERGPLRGMEVADFQKEGVKPQTGRAAVVHGHKRNAWKGRAKTATPMSGGAYMTSFRKLGIAHYRRPAFRRWAGKQTRMYG